MFALTVVCEISTIQLIYTTEQMNNLGVSMSKQFSFYKPFKPWSNGDRTWSA